MIAGCLGGIFVGWLPNPLEDLEDEMMFALLRGLGIPATLICKLANAIDPHAKSE